MFVKICGVTTPADGRLCASAGCDAIGLNLVPGSKRQITPEQAGDIAKSLPTSVLAVGIFRNHEPELVVEVVTQRGLDAAQLHGHESVEETRWIAQRVPLAIKAFTAGGPGIERRADWPTDPILLDAAEPGSGEIHDWALARLSQTSARVILAGGLNPGNVIEAMRSARPWGVDVASGVESAPGIKDPQLVTEFVNLAKANGRSQNTL